MQNQTPTHSPHTEPLTGAHFEEKTFNTEPLTYQNLKKNLECIPSNHEYKVSRIEDWITEVTKQRNDYHHSTSQTSINPLKNQSPWETGSKPTRIENIRF